VFQEVVQGAARGIHRTGRGALFDVAESGVWVETMERNGWRASSFGSFEQFWSGLTERGGWWDPVYDFGERRRTVRTASGKLEFTALSQALGEKPAKPATARGDFPLKLYLYPLLTAYGDAMGPLPWVQDVMGREMGQIWTLWVELSPGDAGAQRVSDGDLVVVESSEGKVEARVRVYPGVRPGVAAMPLGAGGTQGELFRRAFQQAAGALVRLERDTATHPPAWADTWVRVRKA
jgi:anaerobic selenocysteine-containing dehydrogenase